MDPAPVLAGLGWSWAGGCHRINNHAYEGKILLNSLNNGVADFLGFRHDIDI